MPARIDRIFRFPVKGMSPEPLERTVLAPDETVPRDRIYAIENGPSGFDPSAPAWMAKTRFLCWMANPRLAGLRARLDGANVLTIEADGLAAVSGDLTTAAGRRTIEAALTDFMGEEARGPLRILTAPGHSFSDVAARRVSLINLGSARDLSQEAGAPVAPERFRANIHLAELPAWAEAGWLGRTLAVGPDVRLKIVKMIRRCLATHVDPRRGIRDVEVMQAITRRRGNLDCGVYAQVVEGGEVAIGMAVHPV